MEANVSELRKTGKIYRQWYSLCLGGIYGNYLHNKNLVKNKWDYFEVDWFCYDLTDPSVIHLHVFLQNMVPW